MSLSAAKATLSPHSESCVCFLEFLFWANTFAQRCHLRRRNSGMYEGTNICRTAQEGGGEEFPGPAQVHVAISVFTVMDLAGGSKGNLPQAARAALSWCPCKTASGFLNHFSLM